MPSFLTIVFMMLALLTVSSCGGEDGSSDEQRQEEGQTSGGSNGVDLTYDSELSNDEANALTNSTSLMSSLNIDGSQIRRFSQIFGGNTSSDVVSFFETRVNYALSAATNLESRLVASSAFALEAQTLASNPSTVLWYIAEINDAQEPRFRINNRNVPIRSSRIGVMQFGESFSTLDPILQVMTLVHEARHSDCTGGALRSDLERVSNGQLPENNACGHLHVTCPPGHPYAGEPACDEHPWGAYVTGAIYAGSISLACPSCTEAQRTVAEAISLDSLSRLLYDFDDLMNGTFGPPDMSSSSQIK
jgi:hypothetical protein